MMISLRRGTCLSLLLLPVASQGAALKAVPTTLNPAKAYILVEYKRVPNPFAGSPLAPKYLPQFGGLSLARYDVELRDVRGLGKAASRPLPGKTGPLEPFRNRPAVKSETAVLYLHEVEPDAYVVMGWSNTSFSLGSYLFEAKPGTVTDLGVVSAIADWPKGEEPQPQSLTVGKIVSTIVVGPFAKPPPIAPARAFFRPRGVGDLPLPPSLPVERVIPVSFQTGATFGNYLGGLVNRIEGVNARADGAVEPIP